MPLTMEERQEIIHEACQKAILMLPEVVGTLMMEHAALLDVNKKFYSEHSEFNEHRGLVQSVVEQLEGHAPAKSYQQLLQDAVPIIRDRLKTIKGLDMDTIQRTERRLTQLTVPDAPEMTDSNGAL